jgi:hypothetical protein
VSNLVYLHGCGAELESRVVEAWPDGRVRRRETWCPACDVQVGFFIGGVEVDLDDLLRRERERDSG